MSGADRAEDAELAQAPGQRRELVLARPPRAGRVGPGTMEQDLLDGEGGEGRGHGATGRGKVVGMRSDAQMTAQRIAELNRRLQLAFIQGAEERSRGATGRGLTADELRRVLRQYPGDLPER